MTIVLSTIMKGMCGGIVIGMMLCIDTFGFEMGSTYTRWYAGTYLYYYNKIDGSVPPHFLCSNRLDLDNNEGYV